MVAKKPPSLPSGVPDGVKNIGGAVVSTYFAGAAAFAAAIGQPELAIPLATLAAVTAVSTPAGQHAIKGEIDAPADLIGTFNTLYDLGKGPEGVHYTRSTAKRLKENPAASIGGSEDPSWTTMMLGDHPLGLQSGLHHRPTGGHPSPKRPRLGLGDEWFNSAEQEGRLAEKHQITAPTRPSKRRKGNSMQFDNSAKRSKFNLTGDVVHHKINPFFPFPMTSMRKSTGFPHTKKMIHRFSTNEGVVTQLSGDNTVGQAVAANAIENPHASGQITTNALLYDQMAVMYNRYTVTKATIRVDFFNKSTVDGKIVGISLKDDTVILVDTGHYAELGDTIYKSVSPLEHTQIVLQANPAKYFGVKKSNALADDRLSCATGSDARPDDKLFFHVWAAPIDGSNTGTAACQYYTTVEYEVVWQQPIEINRSTD